MTALKQWLRETYLSPLKEKEELYIGVELEFPIVNCSGQATDTRVSKGLLIYLSRQFHFEVEQHDADGYPVQLFEPKTEDRILFEVSYNILEIAFGRAKRIQEVKQRFQTYLDAIQLFLRTHGHELQGHGIHPTWDKNDNSAVKLPRYQMLMNYLALAHHEQSGNYHSFVDYGAFICSNQVQLDVTRSNYLRVLNAFNKIEPAKAYLFANSAFLGADWDTTIARDIFWEQSLHGALTENVGLFPQDFQNEEAFLTYMSQTALFTVERDGETYYFQPKSLSSYLASDHISAYVTPETLMSIKPQLTDLATHRTYHYNSLTRRGTVESRSVCTQTLDSTFSPIAFQLGLLANIAELEDYLSSAAFFQHYGRHYPALRRQFSKKSLTEREKEDIQKFANDLLLLARKGLEKRGFGEGIYLEQLNKTF